MNRTYKIVLPIVLAVAIVAGILLGVKIQQTTSQSRYSKNGFFQPDKLSLILRLIERDYVDTIDKDKFIEQVIPGILEELDPHTHYIPAQEMVSVNEEMRGNFSGIGVQFVMQNDSVTVVDVVSGGPSHQLGILAGDRIIKVNGENVSGIGLKSDSIVSLLRGKKGTMVLVTIHRSGIAKSIDFNIERGEIPLFSIDVSFMITDNIGFIKVNRFSETTYKEFIKGIEILKSKGASKLIVDLRGNSGGYLQSVFRMVDEFLPENKMIVYTQGKSRARDDYMSTSRGIWKEGDVAVLIDEYSASASEIFAGAIQDNDRGIVVGRRSFGKGLVQEQIPFMDGSSLRLTVARFYTPSGRCIQKSYENGTEEYYSDLQYRMKHEEMLTADSIQFNDSLKYYTTGGRMVYGGGGIMPDFFVPVDTTGINDLYVEVVSKNLIYRYAFSYADDNRKTLNNLKTALALQDYLVQQKIGDKFTSYLKAQGIKVDPLQYAVSKQVIDTQLYALIARNIFGEEGFYPIIFQIDNTVKKAVELMKSDWPQNQVAQIVNKSVHD
jgi:carboxyl-terminal processing protease